MPSMMTVMNGSAVGGCGTATKDAAAAKDVAAAAAAEQADAAAAALLAASCAGRCGAPRRPFIIGVAGGTASGKTTVCNHILSRLRGSAASAAPAAAALISQDSFYRPLTPAERANVGDYDFDAPSAFDSGMLLDAILSLKAGRAAEVPVYDFATHSRRAGAARRVGPADVVIVEGILVLHDAALRAHLDVKVFVDADADVRLARRVRRDVAERGRDVAGVIAQYTRFVKPAFDRYVAPSRRHADVIVPWQQRGANLVAVDLIAARIRGVAAAARGQAGCDGCRDGCRAPCASCPS